MMKKIFKYLCVVLIVFSISSVAFNTYQWFTVHSQQRPISDGWYQYDRADLYTNEAIYPAIVRSIPQNGHLFISVFLWGWTGKKDAALYPYDVKLAQHIKEANVSGEAFIDTLNFNYSNFAALIKNNPVITTASNLHWHILSQEYAIPNNLLMWPIANPIIQNFIYWLNINFIRQLYHGLKLASNHQKIVIINHGEKAWIGSRNFARGSWDNMDHMVLLSGDIAKVIYFAATETIARLNNGYTTLPNEAKKLVTTLKTKSVNLNASSPEPYLAKVLYNSEIKPMIIALIQQSSAIDAEVNLFSDSDIISALNQFIDDGGKLRLILDPNLYIFNIRLPDMPNVIANLDLNQKAMVKIAKTNFQMHTKAALFTLKNGLNIYLGGSSNWTTGALSRYSWNELGLVLIATPHFTEQFDKNFKNEWAQAIPRDDAPISHARYKYLLTKLMLFTGLCPW